MIVNAGLGGGVAAPAPGGQPEKWMRPLAEQRSAVDWNDPRYATPQPAPTQRYGGFRKPFYADVPQLPERNISVKSKAPAVYYTLEGNPIPADQWVTVPISPTLMQAIKDGDLERGPDPVDEPPQERRRQPGQHRRHAIEAGKSQAQESDSASKPQGQV